jgi:hypothetical protein
MTLQDLQTMNFLDELNDSQLLEGAVRHIELVSLLCLVLPAELYSVD